MPLTQKKGGSMLVRCPTNKDHNEFVTVAHVAQSWVVDETGSFLEVLPDTEETVAKPHTDNIWSCNICGAEADVIECS